MKSNRSNKPRQAVRQRLSRKLLVTAGLSVAALTVVLVIYFQFFKNETIKAEEKQILTTGEIPVDFNIEKPLIAEPDTLSREGNRFKAAKPLNLTPEITE